MYEYTVKRAIKIVDGDTFDLVLDLGFHVSAAYRFRLAEVDTPEIYGRNAEPLGYEARAFASGWIHEALEARDLRGRTFKLSEVTPVPDGGFGRWLIDLFRPSTGEHLADALRDAGMVKG